MAVMPMVIQRTSGVSMVLPADFGLCDYNAVVADDATLNMMARSPEHLASIAKLAGKADLVMFQRYELTVLM